MYRLLDTSSPLWNGYIAKLPLEKQDVYFTSDYHRLYEVNGDGKALLFVYEEDKHFAIYPFLIKKIEEYDIDGDYYDIQSVYGYSGPLASTDEGLFLNNFESCFIKYAEDNNIIAEFVRFHPFMGNENIFRHNIQVIPDRKTVYLDLTADIDEIYAKRLNSNAKRCLGAAKEASLTKAIHGDYSEFSGMYIETMKYVEAKKYYFFSDEYFKDLSELKGLFFLSIKKDELPLSSGAFMIYKNYGHYHLGGNNKEMTAFKPMHFLLWEAIVLAKENGCRYFHFGGGRTGADNDNLLRFKKNFSKETKQFYIGKRILNKEIYDKVLRQWEIKSGEKADILLAYRS